MSNCEWFKCARPFEIGVKHNQRFCTRACHAAEANWRAMRGKTLVPMLILWRKSRNWKKSQKRLWEAKNGEIPSLALIARRVDALVAEQRDFTP